MTGRYDSHSGEESALWSASISDLKALRDIHVIGEVASRQVNRLRKSLYNLDDDKRIIENVDKLERYSRNYVEALDSEYKLLENAQENLGLLIALRQATESGIGGGEESRRKKRKMTEIDTSLEVTRPRKHRSLLDTLVIGAPVAFKQPKTKGSEGDWIQCNITRINAGEGLKARCEVQDPEPDENGAPGSTYKTILSHLIPIPLENMGLPPYSKGAHVLARYPETTTFYRAEVVSTKRDVCFLRFEGEEEFGKETEVERRLVLELPKA